MRWRSCPLLTMTTSSSLWASSHKVRPLLFSEREDSSLFLFSEKGKQSLFGERERQQSLSLFSKREGATFFFSESEGAKCKSVFLFRNRVGANSVLAA